MDSDIADASTRRVSWPMPAEHEAAAAVASLFSEHRLSLVRMAVVLVGDVGTAEDVVQDAFEKLHRRWHGLRDKESALAYARATVLNGCRNVVRRAILARKHAARAAHAATLPADGHDCAESLAEHSELLGALRSLPHRQREVLVLRYYLDLDVAEVADVLKIGPSAVRSSTSRGLARLARVIKED